VVAPALDARDGAAVAAAFGLRAGDLALGVFAHPDDEAWSAGGTCAALVDAGVRVRVIFATDGEAGRDDLRRGWSKAALGAHRRTEARAAAAVLGCEEPVFLGAPDGGLAAEGPDASGARVAGALRQALIDQLATARPQVLLGLGDDGGYPHRDHVALVAACVAACAVLGPTAPPHWQAAFAPGIFAPLLRALRRAGATSLLDPAWPAERLGWRGAQQQAVCLDIGALAARKTAAIAAHRSQLRGGDPLALLGPGVVASLLERETWGRAGPAVALARG